MAQILPNLDGRPTSICTGIEMKNLWSIACLFFFLIQAFVSRGQLAGGEPVITGQIPSPLVTLLGTPVTLTLANLIVTPGDPASIYPDGFTLEVNLGKHYDVSGATVTPDPNYVGPLTVPVRVKEGDQDSKWFNLKINVVPTLNIAPLITGQTPISINQGEDVTITFAQLMVIDPDDTYPSDFTLTVYGGSNYTVSGTTVTPAPDFFGDLQVPVSVNDGESESNKFKLKIEVIKNVAPRITGQIPISINQGQSVTVDFNQLTVTDPDDSYPSGFTLTVYSGTNYTVNGSTVTPAPNFSGNLKVPVSVNDGKAESNRFDLKIDVKAQPIAPTITGQRPLTVNEDESIAIKLTDLSVVDPDNSFPQDFTLTISPGAHYTVNGNVVILEKNYSGPLLSVVVNVNDGANDSPPFDLQISVTPVNDGPVITGQRKLTANQGTTFSISLSDLTVTDPDNQYPNDFTLKIAQGNNYVAAGNTISPSPTFVGTLNVTVSVNDGTTSSPDFNLQVAIIATKTNVPPTIVGQKAISITQNTSITVELFHLEVNDPDNTFPAGFSLKVFPGTNYTVTGTKVTPVAGFVNGTLQVGVQVNDGQDDSPLFQLKVQVTPISATPRINGQKELVVLEDYPITIYLSDLFVTDEDNPNYPQGFSLSVKSGSQGTYTANGNTVTPAPNLNGFIEVGVTVSDGVNTSDEFKLAILVSPVNDAPVITLVETSPIPFEPGKEPAEVLKRMELADVDNVNLSMAEIGFREASHSLKNDELLFEYVNPKIKAIRDSAGVLFLIGNATVEEYEAALRTIKYNYRITEDSNGNPEAILSGSRTIYVYVSDGQRVSLTSERIVDVQGKIEIDIPSAFTPNGDQANDTWHVQLLNKDKLDQAIIKVYNKRGLLLYEASGFERDWDATYNGERLPVDTYYYTIVIELPYGRQTYKGVVTILY